MMNLDVKSGLACPMCGNEMRITSGTFYYENELGLISLECNDCDLGIDEYCFHHRLKNGDTGSYWKLYHALIGRASRVFEKV